MLATAYAAKVTANPAFPDSPYSAATAKYAIVTKQISHSLMALAP